MPDRIRVATWNCFGVPAGVFGFLFGSPHLPERFRIAQIARALASYDVVCVQESFLDAVAEFFDELADLLGLHLWHDRMLPHVRERSMFGGGLAILATQPLDVAFKIFPAKASGFDAWACKGYATCELTTRSGAAFRLVNMHLQSEDPKDEPAVYLRARAAQIDSFLDGLAALTDKKPTIVCGDLNVPEGSDEYHRVLLPRMAAHGFTDVGSGMGLLTYTPARNALLRALDPHAIEARYDYVWTADGERHHFRVRTPPELLLAEPLSAVDETAPPLFASDHFGIGVELELLERA